MNTELKEKMQKAAEKISSLVQSDEIFKELIEVIFMSGASTMYAELAPLVEWVSVKDRLPEEEINRKSFHVLIKTDIGFIRIAHYCYKRFTWLSYDGTLISKKDIGNVTHWRKIEI